MTVWRKITRAVPQRWTPQTGRRIEEMKRELVAEMPLHELCRARVPTQQELAETLQVGQTAIAKLQQRTDICVSSLRSYIEAMGGRLRIVAEFPEGEVAITKFSRSGTDERDLDCMEAGNPPGAGCLLRHCGRRSGWTVQT